ncbi:hypothetical protein SRHO_G00027960 [Serrasalmus rhombeus]
MVRGPASLRTTVDDRREPENQGTRKPGCRRRWRGGSPTDEPKDPPQLHAQARARMHTRKENASPIVGHAEFSRRWEVLHCLTTAERLVSSRNRPILQSQEDLREVIRRSVTAQQSYRSVTAGAHSALNTAAARRGSIHISGSLDTMLRRKPCIALSLKQGMRNCLTSSI